jgi:hypothetical protein
MLLTLLQSGGPPIDHQPVAVADSYSVTQDVDLVVPALTGVLANDTGLEDGGLVLTVIGVVIGGSVILANDGSFTFTPTPGFTGPASFTYRVTDVDGDWAEALVSIDVTVAVPIGPVIDYPYTTTAGNVGGGFSRTRVPSSRRALYMRRKRKQQLQDDADVIQLVQAFLTVMED